MNFHPGSLFVIFELVSRTPQWAQQSETWMPIFNNWIILFTTFPCNLIHLPQDGKFKVKKYVFKNHSAELNKIFWGKFHQFSEE